MPPEGKYYTTDRFGRGVGSIGLTSEEIESKRLADKGTKAEIISGLIQLASTVYGGVNLASGIKELGLKGALKKTFKPPGADEAVKVLKKVPREGFKSILPDFRNLSEKYKFHEGIKGEDIESLFNLEEIERLKKLNMLDEFSQYKPEK